MKSMGRKILDNAGATMVEVALSMIVIMGFIGVIFDFGLMLHDYNMLTYLTHQIARKAAATETDLTAPGESWPNELAETRKQIMKDQFNFEPVAWTLGAPDPYRYAVTSKNDGCLLFVRMRRKMRCFFCILYSSVVGSNNLEALSVQLVENHDFCNAAQSGGF